MSTQINTSIGRRFERAADCLSQAERYFAGTLLILMTGLYALNIFVRTVFSTYASHFAWIDEAARYMMVWVVFISAGVALEVGRHVSVNLAHERMPPHMLTALFKLIDLVGLAFSLAIAWFALNLVVFVAETGQVSPTLGVPTYILYLAPAIGFASLALRYLLQLFVRDMRRNPKRPLWLGSGHI